MKSTLAFSLIPPNFCSFDSRCGIVDSSGSFLVWAPRKSTVNRRLVYSCFTHPRRTSPISLWDLKDHTKYCKLLDLFENKGYLHCCVPSLYTCVRSRIRFSPNFGSDHTSRRIENQLDSKNVAMVLDHEFELQQTITWYPFFLCIIYDSIDVMLNFISVIADLALFGISFGSAFIRNINHPCTLASVASADRVASPIPLKMHSVVSSR